jgi:hypothetical protein
MDSPHLFGKAGGWIVNPVRRRAVQLFRGLDRPRSQRFSEPIVLADGGKLGLCGRPGSADRYGVKAEE